MEPDLHAPHTAPPCTPPGPNRARSVGGAVRPSSRLPVPSLSRASSDRRVDERLTVAMPRDELDERLSEFVLRIETMPSLDEESDEAREIVDAHAAIRVHEQRKVGIVGALRCQRGQEAADALVVPDFVGDDLLVGSHASGGVEKGAYHTRTIRCANGLVTDL